MSDWEKERDAAAENATSEYVRDEDAAGLFISGADWARAKLIAELGAVRNFLDWVKCESTCEYSMNESAKALAVLEKMGVK